MLIPSTPRSLRSIPTAKIFLYENTTLFSESHNLPQAGRCEKRRKPTAPGVRSQPLLWTAADAREKRREEPALIS